MMKNLPCEFHRDALVELLNHKGFSGQFDFVHLPVDFQTGSPLHYGFVNFVSSISAQKFLATFDGFGAWEVRKKKVARLVWSELQGLDANLDKYRNSSVMHAGIPEHFKPLLFRNGEVTPFPSLTCALQSPTRLDSVRNGVPASQLPLQLVGACQAGALAPSCYTTVLLRNIPNDYNRSMLENVFNSQGFLGLYDFLYLPVDFQRQCSLGYSFVNFVNHISAQHFFLRFSGFCSWGLPTRKVAKVEWAKPQCQGLEAHVARYRGRPVMNSNVPDECKPAVFFHGVRIAFPTGREGPRNARAKFS
jgi:RNA recognition motif-containing protein